MRVSLKVDSFYSDWHHWPRRSKPAEVEDSINQHVSGRDAVQ